MGKDDEFVKNMLNTVNQSIVENNTISATEFQKYAPLFDNTIRQGNLAQKEEGVALIRDYRAQFSPYHPIVITDDAGTTVQVLPPAMVQAPIMNGLIKKSGALMQEFNAITANPSQPEHKKLEISSVVRDAGIYATKHDKNFQKRKAIAAKLARDFDERNTKSTLPEVQKAASDKTVSMEWD